MQEDEIGYASEGIGRIIVLVLLSSSTLGALVLHFTWHVLPERLARPIEYHKDVLRHR